MTHIRGLIISPLIWVITIVILLVTLLISNHEPPSIPETQKFRGAGLLRCFGSFGLPARGRRSGCRLLTCVEDLSHFEDLGFTV